MISRRGGSDKLLLYVSRPEFLNRFKNLKNGPTKPTNCFGLWAKILEPVQELHGVNSLFSDILIVHIYLQLKINMLLLSHINSFKDSP
jgi:hypothetical protein